MASSLHDSPVVRTFDYMPYLQGQVRPDRCEKEEAWKPLPGHLIRVYDSKRTPAQTRNCAVNIALFLGAIAEAVVIYLAYQTCLSVFTCAAVALGIILIAGAVWRCTQGPDLDSKTERDAVSQEASEKIQQHNLVDVLRQFTFEDIHGYDLLHHVTSMGTNHLRIKFYAQVERLSKMFNQIKKAHNDNMQSIQLTFSLVAHQYYAIRGSNRMARHGARQMSRDVIADRRNGIGSKIAAGSLAFGVDVATRSRDFDASGQFALWTQCKQQSEKNAVNAFSSACHQLNSGLDEILAEISQESTKTRDSAHKAKADAAAASVPPRVNEDRHLKTDGVIPSVASGAALQVPPAAAAASVPHRVNEDRHLTTDGVIPSVASGAALPMSPKPSAPPFSASPAPSAPGGPPS
jgi:outer membrane murein-binding lipoprotein Lpp